MKIGKFAQLAALACLCLTALIGIVSCGTRAPPAQPVDPNESLPIEEKHSFAPPFLFGTSNIPFWDYGGSAVATEEMVRLVPAIRSRAGWIWNTEPVQFDNWEVELEFRIHNTRSPGADGMAFWLVKDRSNVEGSLYGMVPDFDGIGVVFDTYDNDAKRDNPRVVAIKNDGSAKEWDIPNDLQRDQLASCMSYFRNTKEHVKAKITYNQNVLQVMLDTDNSGNFQYCLSVDNLVVSRGYYFGVTAATGGLADYHDLFRFSTRDLTKRHVNVNQAPEIRKRGRWWDPYRNANTEQQQPEATPIPTPVPTSTEDATDKLLKAFQQKLEQQKLEQQQQQQQQPTQQASQQYQHYQATEEQKQQADTQDANQLLVDNVNTLAQALAGIKNDLRDISTKADINRITSQVQQVTNKQTEFSNELNNFKSAFSREISTIMEKFKSDSDKLIIDIRKLDAAISSVNEQIDRLNRQQGKYSQTMYSATNDLKETIRRETGWSIWTWLVLSAPTIFFAIVSLFLWKKLAAQEKARKYL
eukprot:GEZU01024293.1.p1 GENE.GEZU01024293.1~~GEZU01024293.1.p1  ORF type:complete len:528 (+),score=140.71 GEZU01024293.1:92-1675(+)